MSSVANSRTTVLRNARLAFAASKPQRLDGMGSNAGKYASS
jgi:hypothetical protein